MSNKELSDLGQTLLGNPLNDELKIAGGESNLLLKSLSTPVSRSALLVTAFAFIVLLGFIFAPNDLWRNIFGIFLLLIIVAAVAFVLIIPIIKPELAQSDIKTMFIYILDTMQKSAQLPTQLNGATIETANLEQLTQPKEHTLSLTENVSVSDQINEIKKASK